MGGVCTSPTPCLVRTAAFHVETSSGEWEALFMDLLSHMRVLSSTASLRQWQKALTSWKVCWGDGLRRISRHHLGLPLNV